jgi:hypothetical protein
VAIGCRIKQPFPENSWPTSFSDGALSSGNRFAMKPMSQKMETFQQVIDRSAVIIDSR